MLTISQNVLTDAFPFFADLSRDDWEKIVGGGLVEHHDKGDKLYTEGDPVTHLYFLKKGSIKIYKDGLGQNAYLRMARPNTFFDLRPYFTSRSYAYTAEACGAAIVYKIPAIGLEQAFASNPKFTRSFLSVMAEDMEHYERRNLLLQQKEMRGRMADTLLYLIQLYGYEPDGVTLSIQLSRSDLSSLSNMTPSNASRVLSAFASERIISLERKLIKVVNPAQLEHVSNLDC